MSRQDREPPWLTWLKDLAAMVLVLLALAFGAGGACGVWDSLSRRSWGPGGYAVIAAICGVIGLGVAGLLIWGVVLLRMMFRKKREE